MRCLSIQPPMAAALLLGPKDYENRTWRPKGSIGTVLIHNARRTWRMEREQRERFEMLVGRSASLFELLPPDHIIGAVDFIGAQRAEDVDSWWATGPWCWQIDAASRRVFQEPIPYTGRLKLYEVDDDLVAEAMATAWTPKQWLVKRRNDQLESIESTATLACPLCGGIDAHQPGCPRGGAA
jgi:hypothetical protein